MKAKRRIVSCLLPILARRTPFVWVARIHLRATTTRPRLVGPGQRCSATGTRTRVARVRAEYPNQLDYSGLVGWHLGIHNLREQQKISPMDKASAYGAGNSKFEFCQGQLFGISHVDLNHSEPQGSLMKGTTQILRPVWHTSGHPCKEHHPFGCHA